MNDRTQLSSDEILAEVDNQGALIEGPEPKPDLAWIRVALGYKQVLDAEACGAGSAVSRSLDLIKAAAVSAVERHYSRLEELEALRIEYAATNDRQVIYAKLAKEWCVPPGLLWKIPPKKLDSMLLGIVLANRLPDELVTLPEIGREYQTFTGENVDVNTLRQWLKRPGAPRVKGERRQSNLYLLRELDAFFASQFGMVRKDVRDARDARPGRRFVATS